MKNRTLLISLIFFTLFSFKNNDTEPSYFVQFKIFTVQSNANAGLIDNKMRQKSGIKMSRTDYITSTYYAVLNPGIDYTEEQFSNWFNKLGYTIGCFNKGVYQRDAIVSPHELKNCSDEK
jgi:hypothetical protein